MSPAHAQPDALARQRQQHRSPLYSGCAPMPTADETIKHICNSVCVGQTLMRYYWPSFNYVSWLGVPMRLMTSVSKPKQACTQHNGWTPEAALQSESHLLGMIACCARVRMPSVRGECLARLGNI
eukprot:6701831-Alexandrium_andersonii.AAC.1